MNKKIMHEKGYMDSYSSKTFQRIAVEFLNTILLKYCNDPNKTVCSLGCYDDVLAEQIKFKELYLVDMEFGKCFHKSNTKIHYFEESIEKMIFAKNFQNKMDVVLMTNVVEHINETILNNILKHIRNILVPNGIFIFTIPNTRSVNRLVGVELGMLEHPTSLSEDDKHIGHKKMYNYDDITYFGMLLKMEKIEDIGIMFKPLSNRQMDKYFGENLETFIQIGYDLGAKVCSYIGGVFKK